jgi:integrase
MARELRAMVAAEALPKYDTMHKRLSLALKTCGYESSRPIHTMRHTTCSRVVANEKNLPLAQRLLGHKSIQTTMGYVHHDREALREAAKNLSPRCGELTVEQQTSACIEFKRKA